jgi:hypothetical protein
MSYNIRESFIETNQTMKERDYKLQYHDLVSKILLYIREGFNENNESYNIMILFLKFSYMRGFNEDKQTMKTNKQ